MKIFLPILLQTVFLLKVSVSWVFQTNGFWYNNQFPHFPDSMITRIEIQDLKEEFTDESFSAFSNNSNCIARNSSEYILCITLANHGLQKFVFRCITFAAPKSFSAVFVTTWVRQVVKCLNDFSDPRSLKMILNFRHFTNLCRTTYNCQQFRRWLFGEANCLRVCFTSPTAQTLNVKHAKIYSRIFTADKMKFLFSAKSFFGIFLGTTVSDGCDRLAGNRCQSSGNFWNKKEFTAVWQLHDSI